MSRNVCRCSQFPRMGRRDSLTCRWNLRFFKMFNKFARQIFSQNSHRIVAGVSNPSRILLNLVSVSQKVWGMWDKFVRGWRPMKLNYDWLETKMRIWHSGRECRTTIARHSCYMYANSRRILIDSRQKWESDIPGARHAQVSYAYRASVARHSLYIMRTPGVLWQYLQQYSCDIRKCVVKYQFNVIVSEKSR